MRGMHLTDRVFVTVLVLHMFPHPLYDAIAYVGGALGVPFLRFLFAAFLGGGILLAYVCFMGIFVVGGAG